MQNTMLDLCKEIQSARLGYIQSDEITIICIPRNYTKNEAFYNNSVEKLLSVLVSKATKLFNMHYYKLLEYYKQTDLDGLDIVFLETYEEHLFQGEFYCRIMTVPEWDVLNCLIWRQQDAIRNGILLLAQSLFSEDELYKKKLPELKKMVESKGYDLSTYPKERVYGSCAYVMKNDKGRNF